MRRSIDRIHASNRARQLRLTVAAAFGLAVLGASTLYLVHRTMPTPMQTAPGSYAPRQAEAPASAAKSAPRSDPQDLSAASAVGPLPRPESAPVSLRVPMPSEGAEHVDGAAGDRRAHDTRTRRPAGREAARGDSAGPPRTEQEAARSPAGGQARSGWSGELETGIAGSDGVQGASTGTRGANTSPSIQARATAPPRNAPQRLESLQQTQCAGSEFLMKLICDERVRLGFCQSRWNAHPDCMVEARTLTY